MAMSKWTHAICATCWEELYPDRNPVRESVYADYELCCFCGITTNSGVYVRHDPNDPKLVCKGEHTDNVW